MAASRYSVSCCALLLALQVVSIGHRAEAQSAAAGQWAYYGGDNRATKYSPLDQINKDNVGKLAVAWSWDSPDNELKKTVQGIGSFAYEVTPIIGESTREAYSDAQAWLVRQGDDTSA